MSGLRRLALTIVLVYAAIAPARASFIEGHFNMTFGTLVVSATEIDFGALHPGVDIAATYGSFTVDPTVASRSGSFLDPVFNTLPSDGTIGDLSNNPADANYIPVGVPVSRDGYIALAEQPTWNFRLTLLSPGATTGPFSLIQVGPNVSASFSVNGIAWKSATPGDISDWTAIISAQYTNATVAELIAFVVGGGVLPENSWSGTFEAEAGGGGTEIPEPGAYALIGSGLLALALLRKKLVTK